MTGARVRAFLKPPRSLLARVRWVFLWGSLATVLLAALMLSSHPAPWWPIRPVALLGLVWLCWHWIRGYRRGRFPAVSLILEGLALFLVTLANSRPEMIIVLLYTGTMFRSLYGTRRRVLVTLLTYLGAFYGAVALSLGLGYLAESVEELLSHLFGLAIAAAMLHLLAVTLARSERTLYREKVLQSAGAALVATQNRESVYATAVETALELTKEAPKARVGLARGSADGMTVVASAGYRADEIRDDPLDPDALPDHLRDRFLERQPIEVADAELVGLREALGLSSGVRTFFVVPLFIERELQGALGVASDSPLSGESKEALVSLGFQVALALESVAFAEDRHWRRSEARFRALIQNSSDLVMALEADGTINYVSPSVRRMLGYAAEDLIGESAFAFVHPDDIARTQDFHARTMTTPGVEAALEVRVRHSNGSWRYLEAVGNNLLEDPDVRAIVLNFRDVTERKRAELALRESEAGLAQAQQIAHLGSWGYDPKEGKAYWSDETYRIFGYSP